jgi:hypothetical protein
VQKILCAISSAASSEPPCVRAVHDLADVVGFLFLSPCTALWIGDVVLNLCLILFLGKKHHP